MKQVPTLFIGHGSPMNAIEDNSFVREWQALAEKLPRPEAILSVSAHWYTKGTMVMDDESPRTIYDMYGFPEELYKIIYGAKGRADLSQKITNLISRKVEINNSWGYDHGTWSVLHRMYPKADIPLIQLSVDKNATMQEHYDIGKQLTSLRKEGVLIFGSGNVTHNLSKADWNMQGGYGWAEEFDGFIKDNIQRKDYGSVIDYKKIGSSANYAVPITDHYAPLLYVLGALDGGEKVSVFNDECIMGSLSMTSYLFE